MFWPTTTELHANNFTDIDQLCRMQPLCCFSLKMRLPILTTTECHGPTEGHKHHTRPVLISRPGLLLLLPRMRDPSRISHAKVSYGQIPRRSNHTLGVRTLNFTLSHDRHTDGGAQSLRDNELRLQELPSSRCRPCTSWLLRKRRCPGFDAHHRHVGKSTHSAFGKVFCSKRG